MAREQERIDAAVGTGTGMSLMRTHLAEKADRAVLEYFETNKEKAYLRYEAATNMLDMDDDELREKLRESPGAAVKLIEEMEEKLLGR